MANLTENYSLTLPTEDEIVDIEVLNANFTAIDELEAEHDQRIALLEYMLLQNDLYAPIIDDDGSVLIDDEGCPVLVEWSYEAVKSTQ